MAIVKQTDLFFAVLLVQYNHLDASVYICDGVGVKTNLWENTMGDNYVPVFLYLNIVKDNKTNLSRLG